MNHSTQSTVTKDRNIEEGTAEERKKPLTQEQADQNSFELEEARQIMNKRKKRMPLVEDINLDDIFSEAQ